MNARSRSCQKLHYSAPNGFPCLNQTICRRAPGKSELNPRRGIVGGNRGVGGRRRKKKKDSADTRPHSQTRGRGSRYHKLFKTNDNSTHSSLAAFTQQRFFTSRTAWGNVQRCSILQLHRSGILPKLPLQHHVLKSLVEWMRRYITMLVLLVVQ